MSGELIARLEAAEAGDRFLDAAVAVVADRAARVVGGWRYNDEGRAREVEPFTTSLDAALALAERVLPGWGVDVGFPCRLGEHGGRPWASVWPPNNSGLEPALNDKWGRCNPANAAGLPLALCIAILRATPTGEPEA